jgi:hypothetical protein
VKKWWPIALAIGSGGILALLFTRKSSADRYAPGSAEAKALFRRAARRAGVPVAWADSDGLHYILRRESGGWVGRPNYTYGSALKDPANRDRWPEVWAELRQGIKSTRSSATGLGQLLLSNAERYYPDGREGIGDALNEATGMLKYIQRNYGDPDRAGRAYQLDRCPPGVSPSHMNWLSAGCKSHEGY